MILLTLDSSPASETAIPIAIDLAQKFDRPLRVLLVLDGALRHHFDELARESGLEISVVVENYLAEIADKVRAAGLDAVETAFQYAIDAGTGIVEAASEAEVVLLVMATHGRSGISRWLTGSVTEHVIRTSPVPVVVVPAGTGER